MKRRSFLSCLLWMSWIPLVTVVAAVGFQVLRVTGKKAEYYALGRIVAGVKASPPQSGKASIQMGTQADFYGTQRELLESGALKIRAYERVRALHPELKEIDVEIRVTQTQGSAILNIAAVGDEPKYTQIYLNSLLDEYIAFRKEMIDKSIGMQMSMVIEQVLAHEKVFKEKKAALDQFERANDPALLSAEHERRVKEVSKLRGELEELKRSGPDESKMKALMEHLEQADKARADLWEKTSRQLELRKDFEDAQKAYEEWKKTMERLDNSSQTEGGMVAIMERPSVAVEQEPDLWKGLIMWAVAGFSFGVILMFAAAGLMFAMGRSGAEQTPRPLV